MEVRSDVVRSGPQLNASGRALRRIRCQLTIGHLINSPTGGTQKLSTTVHLRSAQISEMGLFRADTAVTAPRIGVHAAVRTSARRPTTVRYPSRMKGSVCHRPDPESLSIQGRTYQAGFEKRGHFWRGHWPSKEIALTEFADHVLQLPGLSPVFDSLGHDMHIQVLSQLNDRIQYFRLMLHCRNKRTVYF